MPDEGKTSADSRPPDDESVVMSNGLFDLFGPAAVGPGVGLLFLGSTSTPRLLIYVVLHTALAVAFPAAIWRFSRRRPPLVRRTEALWTWSGGLVVASIPWLLSPEPRWSHYALGLIFISLSSSDVLFKALRPAFPWRSVLIIQTISYTTFLVLSGSWPVAIACIIHATHLFGGHDAVQELVVRLRSEFRRSETRANTDPLTGLANRRGLNRYLETSRAAGQHVVVAAVDVDDFKQINDRLGHHGGDAALIQLATHMVEGLGQDWLVARSGGDEFVCVTKSGTVHDARAALAHVPGLVFEGSVVPIRVSVGLATGEAEESLLADAFAALRLSKQRGKHQFTPVDDALRDELRSARLLSTQLVEAIEREDIEIWAQPIVHTSGPRRGTVHSYECLARWATPDGKRIPPSIFIPMVADQRLSRELGESIIDQGTSFLAALPDPLRVSINVSATHFVSQGFAEYLHAALAKREIAPARLTIEITESERLATDDATWKVARQLRAMGVGLAIDDFGTGYASLERLVSFPCSQLKLDRSIIEHVGSPGVGHLLSGLTEMARSTEVELVAEGVESPEQAHRLEDSGVPLGQGYLFGRPQPISEILNLHREPAAPTGDRDEARARIATSSS